MKKKRKHPVKYADTPDSGLSFRFSLAGLIQLMLCVVLVLTVLNGYLREGILQLPRYRNPGSIYKRKRSSAIFFQGDFAGIYCTGESFQ